MKYQIGLMPLLVIGLLPFGAICAEPTLPPPTDVVPKDPAVAAAVAPAVAPAVQAEVPPLFKELDRNHDGYVTKDEAKRSAEVTARFSELDTNHDGRVAAVEYIKGTQGR